MEKTQKESRTRKYEVVNLSPVSARRSVDLAAKIEFDIQRCKGCCLCIYVCPTENIKMSEKLNKKGHPYAQLIDKNKCTGCGLCFQICPDLVIEIEK